MRHDGMGYWVTRMMQDHHLLLFSSNFIFYMLNDVIIHGALLRDDVIS